MDHFTSRTLLVLTAPDGGLPGIPGSSGSGDGGSGGSLPGIPGSAPLGGSGATPPSGSQPAPPTGPPAGGPAPVASMGSPMPQFTQTAPPQLPGATFELASWGRRFAVWIVDAVILLLLMIPFVGLASTVGLDTGTSSAGDGSFNFSAQDGQFLAVFGLFLLVVLLYSPTTMVALKGATPGKAALGIRVVRVDGQPVTFGYAVLREWVLKGIVLGFANSFTLGLAGLINYLWPLWDSENRALHDMAAKSRVVRR